MVFIIATERETKRKNGIGVEYCFDEPNHFLEGSFNGFGALGRRRPYKKLCKSSLFIRKKKKNGG